jgi:hypothetical protein
MKVAYEMDLFMSAGSVSRGFPRPCRFSAYLSGFYVTTQRSTRKVGRRNVVEL